MSTPYVPPVDSTATQHDEAQHLAINNTWFRRFLTLVALETTARFYAHDGPCVPISKHLIVKSSEVVHLTEAATLSFIAAKTSIPVPRVLSSFVHRNRAYIVMERIQGLSLPEAWKTLSESDLDSIFAQLRGEHANHENVNEQDWEDIKGMAAKQDGPWPPPVFTHGDLNPFNILVRGDQVVGIIDWEFAGWYPYYWEYTSAWYGNRIRQSWQQTIDRFLEPCPEELKMEITRQKWWGDF
ncbi:phosphotransferase enzyme family protein [Hirsutella rhossiliensis]|uniref:Phosphotransferase enzyme family domain-containing protein n=1 Tax=Hirsutella rhossiliensis TaxID=111463 RepID=A0A9P8MZW2_9HYPO|nr:phosphotransferase enzyme family domain-containing protein [Hirsutella rhossiliensis]KAH0964042.1 phosphotransferase enzyme family domain-containing protein [Hirsutella rhossiliensis]